MALARAQAIIKRPADDAWVRAFGVTHLAGFVDLFSGQADRCRGESVLGWNAFWPPGSGRVRRLSSIVFVRHPALRLRLDLQGIRSGSVGCVNQAVMRILGLREPPGSLVASHSEFGCR